MKGYKRTRYQLVTAVTYMAKRLSSDFSESEQPKKTNNDKTEQLEARIALLFLFDYLLNTKQVPDVLREGFLTDAFKQLSASRYTKLVSEPDPIALFEQRFNQYADRAVNKGKNWFGWFGSDLFKNLVGAASCQTLQSSYPNPKSSDKELFEASVQYNFDFADEFLDKILQQVPALKAYQQTKVAMGETPLRGLDLWKAWLFRV